MAKIKYFVNLPNGMVVTRTSERVYTHAVLVVHKEGDDELLCNFCGSLALAEKQRAKFVSTASKIYKPAFSARVVPVEIEQQTNIRLQRNLAVLIGIRAA